MPHSIAIDGPVGAGKSTVARDVAVILKIPHLDTGAMYRALGLKMLHLGENPNDEASANRVCGQTDVRVMFEYGMQRTLLDGEDVTGHLRAVEAGNAASAVSQWPLVRARMVELQQQIAEETGMVLDGRDIGTRVLPDATLKIFLTADSQARARRRWAELTAKGMNAALEDVLKDLMARDAKDAGRAVDPLRVAEDAVLIDTTHMTQGEVVERIVELYRGKAK